MTHLVLNDHVRVPTARDIEEWIESCRHTGARAIRTGALFPLPAAPFVAAGFRAIDHLALLEADLRTVVVRRPSVRSTRLRAGQLGDAVAIDRAAFADPWSHDNGSLADIRRATPQTRSRVIRRDGVGVAYAISGRADRTGYLQRLAVDPAHQGSGLATALVDDALGWMARRHADSALVNTGIDNSVALRLYESAGFVRRADELTVVELLL